MIHVAGWAADPDSTAAVPVHVYAGSTLIGATQAERPRADVAAAFPAQGPSHGFDLFAGLGGGHHLIRTYAVDIAGSDANALIDERWVDVPTGPPFGHLDLVDGLPGRVHLAGWAIDPDTALPLDLHIYLDGILAGTGRADRDRPDVAGVHPFYGPGHGFDLEIPTSPGFHVAQVYAINVGLPGPNVLIGTAWVVVP
jgi:hypothetical protein